MIDEKLYNYFIYIIYMRIKTTKKALSPLIAAMLLFVITFAISATVSYWFRDSTNDYMVIGNEQQKILESCTSQMIKITDVRIKDNAYHNESSITVFIKNDGSMGNSTFVEARAFNSVNSTPCLLNLSDTIVEAGKTTSAVNANCGSIYFGNSNNKKFNYVTVTTTCAKVEDKFGDSAVEIPTWLD